jgi:hypothetical protein
MTTPVMRELAVGDARPAAALAPLAEARAAATRLRARCVQRVNGQWRAVTANPTERRARVSAAERNLETSARRERLAQIEAEL